MSALTTTRKAAVAVLGLAVLAPLTAPFAPTANAAINFADPALERVWSRTDRPVEERMAVRSWMWGPDTFYTSFEPYMQGPDGRHLVTYFDKSRMEINNPAGDRNAQWFVTNGLLVVDMMAGRIQAGDQQFIPAAPANIPVAGDANGSPETPTYASLARVASLNGDNRAPSRTGQNVREGIARTGGVGTVDNLAQYSRYAVYEPTLGHNIADVFWSFLNQTGTVYENGRYTNGTVVDWLFAMGYPITEPYWIKIRVQNQDRWVLMQAFQRRILTYSPFNPEGWKVEMGNVGRAYYDWRYANAPAPVTPTPQPQRAAISITPTQGDGNTQITIDGRNFPAFAAVMLGVERADANYFRGVGTVAAKGDGTFSARINLPADAARFNEVTITAIANAGAVRATQNYKLSFAPNIAVAPKEVVNNGAVSVKGWGFPAGAGVSLGLLFNTGGVEPVKGIRTDNGGNFDSTLPIGTRPVGSTFKVIATAEGNNKASSDTIRVLAQPAVQVSPNGGPAGVNVTLQGFSWPAGRAVQVGLRAGDSQTVAWLPNNPIADAAGNFSIPVFVGREYVEQTEVRMVVFEPVSTLRMETGYRVNREPAPRQPTLSVNPSVLAVGQPAAVGGTNWQAGATVSIGIGRPGLGVEEWLASATADGNRNFATTITLGARWQNAGQLILTAVIPGKAATANITVVAAAGRITPQGLPVTVSSYTRNGNAALYTVKGSGWQPGSAINVSVVSADGGVNLPATTAGVNEAGNWGGNFYAAAPWAGRPDLGVRATTPDGRQYSLRYLPTTTMTKVQGTSNTYNVVGINWPANASIETWLRLEESGKSEGDLVRSVNADGNGAFSFNIDLPRIPESIDNEVEIRATGQPYSAVFDF